MLEFIYNYLEGQGPAFIAAQVIAVIICIISSVSYFRKGKDEFLIIQAGANILYAIQYSLLGVWSGIIGNSITTVKFLSFWDDARKGRRTSLRKSIIFCVISVIFGAFGISDGWFAIIPIVNAVLVTYATAQDHPVVMRACYTVANTMWIVFNFMSRAYVSALYSVFELIVSLVSVFVFLKTMKNGSDGEMEA